MKNLPTYEEFINEGIINEALGFQLKDDSGAGKPTVVLILDEEAYKKVKNLFDDKGSPKSEEIKGIKSQGYSWDLYSEQRKRGDENTYKIYGVSGDFTFGNAPTYYNQKYRGNKKAAKEVFDIFVNKYLK